MDLDRRSLITAGGLAALAGPALAQVQARPGAAPVAPAAPSAAAAAAAAPITPPALSIPLWNGAIPDGAARPPLTGPVVQPTIASVRSVPAPTLGFYPAPNPDGSAVIVCPGGGYVALSMVGEGTRVAQRLNQDGVSVFILTYRLPGEGWTNRQNVPLQDAQRAVRLIRSRAAEFRIDPKRLGILGFSAGGHLAGSLANLHAANVYAPTDAADSASAKPAYAAMIYPVVTLTTAPFVHVGSRTALVGADASPALIASRSNELLVTADTTPCFLAHSLADTGVPPENSLMFLQALRTQKIPCEAHLFQEGAHGFGLGSAGFTNQLWPDLFVRWMRRVAPAA